MPPPILIDTHAHLYLDQFSSDIGEVVRRAEAAGVSKILLPNIDQATDADMLALAADYPGQCYPMMGLHPCSVKEDYREVLDQVENMLFGEGKWVGVGETGIDLYWDTTFRKEQEISFRRHIEWARELGLPIVIHSRESLDLNIGIIEEMQDGRLTGVFHCFNGTADQAMRIRDAGMMIGLGGVITFRNSGMHQVLPQLDLSTVVLETDAPYLSPVPFRGKRNESSYLKHTAEFLAESMGMTLPEIAGMTTGNALRLFPKCTSEEGRS